jgi:prevent-host-death family protein
MKTVSMLEFRRHAEEIIDQVQKGQHLILTRRGKPVARLEPIIAGDFDENDPFYTIGEIATDAGESLTNEEIDDILYGQ